MKVNFKKHWPLLLAFCKLRNFTKINKLHWDSSILHHERFATPVSERLRTFVSSKRFYNRANRVNLLETRNKCEIWMGKLFFVVAQRTQETCFNGNLPRRLSKTGLGNINLSKRLALHTSLVVKKHWIKTPEVVSSILIDVKRIFRVWYNIRRKLHLSEIFKFGWIFSTLTSGLTLIQRVYVMFGFGSGSKKNTHTCETRTYSIIGF